MKITQKIGYNRCFYFAKISDFLQSSSDEIRGVIDEAYHGNAITTTRESWRDEIEILKKTLTPWANDDAYIVFEYSIPRLGKRIDVVLLIRGVVFCIEFKTGDKADDAPRRHVDQVLDYALDLKYFHLYSANRPIAPILVPVRYNGVVTPGIPSVYEDDNILRPIIIPKEYLEKKIKEVVKHMQCEYDSQQWGENWIISPYSPTPTIVEAARTLYSTHSVFDITRHGADNASTDATIQYILKIIEQSKNKRQKSICFVTGVPGAGKTLVGLDIAVKQTYNAGSEGGAVYLSGNEPLVAVLTEALAQDDYSKNKKDGKKLSDSRREVGKFIQIIHRYRDNMLAKIKNPVENDRLEIDEDKAIQHEDAGYGEVENVAIFDEAQRSWTKERLAAYLKRGGTYGNKLKVPNFPVSEPAFLIWSLNLRKDWAVIVCLVGGGQEIHTGEAGIAEWISSLNTQFREWNIYISDKLTSSEYAEGRVNELLAGRENVTYSNELHLSVNMRSFKASSVSRFVNSLLDINRDYASTLYTEIIDNNYPIVLTRNIETARQWLRKRARASERIGILVTKTAARFGPHAVSAIEQGAKSAITWFLAPKDNVHSSNFLEDAATEISVQGLELDYACVLWDADMRYNGKEWQYYKFNGSSRWDEECNNDNRKYMLNAYRVLLTRARQGLIICVPNGNSNIATDGYYEDSTRLPEFYDSTYRYFKSIGIQEIW